MVSFALIYILTILEIQFDNSMGVGNLGLAAQPLFQVQAVLTSRTLIDHSQSMQDSEADRLYGPAKNDSGPSSAQEKPASESASDVDEIFAGISGSSGDEAKDEDASESGDEDLQTLQKAVQDTLGPITERKRRVRPQVQDEAVPESQFNLPAGELLGHYHYEASACLHACMHACKFCIFPPHLRISLPMDVHSSVCLTQL